VKPSAHLRGRAAEEAARRALEAAGYRVLESNWCTRGAELDVVARDGEGLVFAEVRALQAGPHEPSASIDRTKLRRLLRGARAWLVARGCQQEAWRFVVVAVTLSPEGHAVATEIIEDPFLHIPEFHHGDP
jgi:putative endonuclease